MNKAKFASFSNSIYLLSKKCDSHYTCPSITFQVTDDCCLNCSYCYQTHKGHNMMSKDTIKQCIDLLFKMYDEDQENTLINHHTMGIILEFIGGEPFMNIDTIEYGCDYFINKCLQLNHPWLIHSRFSISSNGILYFTPKVQNFLKKCHELLSLGITIDGPKELHDACRKDFNNQGSFDQAIAAFRDLRDTYKIYPNTKITIAPENLPYLNEIIDFFIQEKCDIINANPINEHKWTNEEGKIYYEQLKILANKLLKNPNISLSLFDSIYGQPLLSTTNENWCGGNGKMLAFDTNGVAYPCIRYMPSSLGIDRPPIIIGDKNGIYTTNEQKELYKDLLSVTRRSQSTDQCFNCSIANGCGWCTAWNYQENGSYNIRSTNLCWMHRARSLANAYYYNKYYIQTNNNKRIPIYLDRMTALQLISNEEYDMLLKLSF